MSSSPPTRPADASGPNRYDLFRRKDLPNLPIILENLIIPAAVIFLPVLPGERGRIQGQHARADHYEKTADHCEKNRRRFSGLVQVGVTLAVAL
jgi:hypothetical protein